MSFRRKLVMLFAAAVVLSVLSMSSVFSVIARRLFEHTSEQRTNALVAQFHKEFSAREQEVARHVEWIAHSEPANRMAVLAAQGSADYARFLNEAKSMAVAQQLDFLEVVDGNGTIISSAQAPAKFGYKDASIPNLSQAAEESGLLKSEELSEGPILGIFAVRRVPLSDASIYVVGGRKLDEEFLATLDLPAGMRTLLYYTAAGGFSGHNLIASSGAVTQPDKLADVIQRVLRSDVETTTIVHWSSNAADDESVQAMPLKGVGGQVMGVLLVADSRREYVELRQRILSVTLLVAGGGILLGILLSSWTAARVTRPVEQLAAAAREVGRGNLATQVQVRSADELGELADAFNRMTRELLEQKERLIQTERVAAWRELARRLAHELKNPLFPLQLTVENLMRARQHSPEMFEEIFRESASTLLTEISNLKAIISRFSEFSKMPQPRFQAVQVTDIIQNVLRLYQAQLQNSEGPAIECHLQLQDNMGHIGVDPDLLHRALSNVILNAIDAMPEGGTLTVHSRINADRAVIEVSDTGNGIAEEECQRLFTPYYTSKQHGTGLGLAIVQSIISDHGGKISVRSQPGQGTTFRIELPENREKIASSAAQQSGATS